MKVSDVMTSEVITIDEQSTVAQVAELLAKNGFSGVPVVNAERKVVGMVTERDLLPKMKGVPFSNLRLPALFGEWLGEQEFEQAISETRERSVKEAMSSEVITIAADDELGRAAALMAQHSVKRLPVVSEGDLVGIITRADIIRAIASHNVDLNAKDS